MATIVRTEGDLVSAIRRVADRIGDPNLSKRTYDEKRERGEPTSRTLVRRFGSWPAACEAAGLAYSDRGWRQWTDQDRINALKKAARETQPNTLTPSVYAEWRIDQADQLEWPSVSQFDDWIAWTRRAGIKNAGLAIRRPVWTDEELLGFLREAAIDMDGPVTMPAYDEYREWKILELDEPVASGAAISHRFGNWTAALEAAGLGHRATTNLS